MRRIASVLCIALLLLTVHGSATANSDAATRLTSRLSQLPGVSKVGELAGKAVLTGVAFIAACSLMIGCDTELGKQVNDVLNAGDDASSIKVGMSYHGPNFSSSVLGARLAIAQLNMAGGVHGRTIELLPRNNLGNASHNLGLVKSLISDEGVNGLIGAEYSSVTIPMSYLAQNSGIPLVSTGATNPAVTDAGDYVYMAAFTDDLQGKVMARVAYNDLEARTAAVLTQFGDVYSEGLAAVFIKNFTGLGGKVEIIDSYKRGTDNVDDQMKAIKAFMPDIIFVPGFNPEVPLIANTGARLGINTTYVGADGWDSPGLLYAAVALEGGIFSTHFSSTVPDEQLSDAAREFIVSYTKVNGIIPDGFAAMAYDATRILVQAMNRTESLRSEEVKAQLAATNNYEGAVFFSGYDSRRHAQKEMPILTIKDGKVVFHSLVRP